MKRKNSDRYEAARNKVVPAAEAAADRIGPKIQDATDRVGPLAQSAADRVGPLAQSAADRVGPLAHSAADKVSPLAHQAYDRVSPYAQQAAERVGPYADSAKKRGAKAAHEALEKYGPALDDALERVTPAVDAARHRVQDDFLPKLSDALDQAAGSAVVVEAGKRGKATAAALKGEVAVLEKKKKSRWIKRLAIIAALGGIAAVAAKKLLGSQDADWQAARPTATSGGSTAPKASTPTTGTTTTGTTTPAPKPSPAAPSTPDTSTTAPLGTPGAVPPADREPVAPASGLPPVAEPVANPATPTDDKASVDAAEKSAGEDGDSAAKPDRSSYGEGSFVGEEPPAGFTIKGNERSKKYHLPDSSGYARTIAEVWFKDEESAQAAGFIRAQR